MGEPHRNQSNTRAEGRNVSFIQEDRSYGPERYPTPTVRSFLGCSRTGVPARSECGFQDLSAVTDGANSQNSMSTRSTPWPRGPVRSEYASSVWAVSGPRVYRRAGPLANEGPGLQERTPRVAETVSLALTITGTPRSHSVLFSKV